MAEDLGERSEDATPKRLRDAREEGNVARSTDASAAVILLAATLILAVALTPLLGLFARHLRAALEPLAMVDAADPSTLREASTPAMIVLAAGLGPMLLIGAVVAYAANVWQVGFLITSKPLMPKPSRLDPIAGLKRILGPRGVVKAIVDLSKVGCVAAVTWITVADALPRIASLPGAELAVVLAAGGWMLFDLALRIVAVLLVLGLIDFAWQRHRHQRDLRMTKQQVKDEFKQTEGDPEVKRRRMRIQRQIALQRIGAAVPKADVVVTNPEHISVAIAYDADRMRAPTVVAMGADHLALRIRQLARRHGVPIVERKPLARALYRHARIGQEIPPEFYKAVAEILAYVYRLDRMAGGRDARRAEPVASRAAG